jgi:hypothetical protein
MQQEVMGLTPDNGATEHGVILAVPELDVGGHLGQCRWGQTYGQGRHGGRREGPTSDGRRRGRSLVHQSGN